MVFFTTPELLEIGGLPFVSPYEKPTRAEALRYYRKVVDTFDLQIAFEENGAVDRRAEDAERARASDGRSSRSRRGRRAACAASGTRATSCSRSATTTDPNLLERARARICRTCITTTASRTRTTGSASSIVGGGNSAAESALELFRAGAHVTLVHRRAGAEVDDQVLGAGRTSRTGSRKDRSRAVQHAA